MNVIGLTGSIATGKSTVSAMFHSLKIPVFDADAYVHALMQPETQSFKEIQAAFPDAIEGGMIHRKKLGAIVFNDAEQLNKLEAILHPKVRAAEIAFIEEHKATHADVMVLDIPLLFETGADVLCDEVWVTHCPESVQRERIMARPGMTKEKYDQILARQMPQEEKMARASRLLPTDVDQETTLQILKEHLKELG